MRRQRIQNPINKRTLEQSLAQVHQGPGIDAGEGEEAAEQEEQVQGEQQTIVARLTHHEEEV